MLHQGNGLFGTLRKPAAFKNGVLGHGKVFHHQGMASGIGARTADKKRLQP